MPQERKYSFCCPNCGYFEASRLTQAEFTICELLAQGQGPLAISRTLGLGYGTIKMKLQRIYRKLDIKLPHPSVQLAVYWHCPLFHIGLKELRLLPPGVSL